MQSSSKGRSQRWTAQLDPERVREAFDEAIIDCYGEYEQHSGLLTMIEQEVKFPFQAQVLGDISSRWSEWSGRKMTNSDSTLYASTRVNAIAWKPARQT